MGAQQINQRNSRTLPGILAWVVPPGLLLGGVIALAMPLLRSGTPWAWELTTPSSLEGATVNADLVSIDAGGATLRRRGERPISLITPALQLPGNANRTIRLVADLPALRDGGTIETPVRLLWQEGDSPAYQYSDHRCRLSNTAADFYFSVVAPPEKTHRLGVQFPLLSESVRIRSISLPPLSASRRLALATGDFAAPEPIVNHSVNFLRGPMMLGRSLNYFLVAGTCAIGGGIGCVLRLRRQRFSWRPAVAIGLAAWLIIDGWATWNLARQLRADVSELHGGTWPEQIAAMNGADFAWAYEQLLRSCPAGSTFAVLSDDAFAPAHRLAYLLAPMRTRVENPHAAAFITVIHAGTARFDRSAGRLTLADGGSVPAELIAAKSADVYLLRRIVAAQSSSGASP